MAVQTDTRIVAHMFPAIRVLVWLNMIAEALIIATGGAVRLTGSGLGCPTWPTCTADSLIPTEELSFHSAIEFGNRLMTGLVGIVALLTLIVIWAQVRHRTDLLVLALVVVTGVIVQGLIGGGVVLLNLDPNLVGVHYVISLLLVCVAAALVFRTYAVPGDRTLAVPRWFARLASLTSILMAVSIAFGIVTTGAGPHSGDSEAGRNGFDAELWEHIHAWPGYALFVFVIVLVVASQRLKLPTARLSVWLLASVLVQIAVGLLQARTGLPIIAVGVHMVLASMTAAAMTVFMMTTKQPARDITAEPEPDSHRVVRSTGQTV